MIHRGKPQRIPARRSCAKASTFPQEQILPRLGRRTRTLGDESTRAPICVPNRLPRQRTPRSGLSTTCGADRSSAALDPSSQADDARRAHCAEGARGVARSSTMRHRPCPAFSSAVVARSGVMLRAPSLTECASCGLACRGIRCQSALSVRYAVGSGQAALEGPDRQSGHLSGGKNSLLAEQILTVPNR